VMVLSAGQLKVRFPFPFQILNSSRCWSKKICSRLRRNFANSHRNI
jgi:hypothetical protein